MWNSFHRVVTTPLKNSNIPFLPSPGNHDASNGRNFKNEREIYKKNFSSVPKDINFIDSSEYPIRYAYAFAEALFISLDATNIYLDSDQVAWLDKILKENNKYSTKILYGHVPLLPFAKNRESDYLRNKAF